MPTKNTIPTIDNRQEQNYTINLAEMQAKLDGMYQMLAGIFQPNLDNETAQAKCASCLEGENDMARLKSKITVNGQDFWITASSAQGLVDKALQVMQQPEPPMPESSAPPFDQYATNWYKLYIEPKVKATTASCVISYIRKQYVPFFGSRPLDRITVDDVQTFLNQRSQYAKSTLKDYRMWLAQIFDAAVDDGYLTKNPAKSRRIAIPSRKVTEREALSEADYMDILNNLGKLEAKDQLYIGLAMLTGMRRGEILGLQYADIDRDGGWIHVRRNVTFPNVNRPSVGTPKSKKGYRDIPILPQLAALLPDRDDESFVFGGETPLSHMQMVNTWIRIGKKIELHGATLHTLRHSFLTMASNSGIEPKTIQALAGHADISITMNRYVHAQMEPIKRAGATLCQKISSLGTRQERKERPQSLVS